jgi:phosphoribosylformylglycinamidine cyclo-ligase
VIDTGAWERPAIFDLIAARGVEQGEMWSTLNMGIGFCLVVGPASVDVVMAATSAHSARVIGEIVDGDGVSLR